jgi:site-specific recombinase XerD
MLFTGGLNTSRFHDLRHTFATRMLRKTQNISLVSKLLGHTNIETTSRYAHVLTSDLRDALDGFSVIGKVSNGANTRVSNLPR